MRFYTGQHRYYCGIDLHARTLYLCILDCQGKIRLHKRLRCEREALLRALEPYRSDLVVGSECIFCWYWLADLCAREQIPFVLGHALYMKAIHGAKAKNDHIDSHKTAVLLRGGAFPVAYVYPPQMRATRDVLRRRLYFVRKRGELLAHVRNTFHQYNLPRPSGQLLYKKNREGLAQAFDDRMIQRTIEADLALADRFDPVIRELERTIEEEARVHDHDTLQRLRTIPGIGRIRDSAFRDPLCAALRHVVRCDEYKPSRRRSRPTSPGSVHRSASSTIRSLYDGANRRRSGLSTTSESAGAAALRLPSQVGGAIPFSFILSRCLSILGFSAFALL